jgi:hypothetical protein
MAEPIRTSIKQRSTELPTEIVKEKPPGGLVGGFSKLPAALGARGRKNNEERAEAFRTPNGLWMPKTSSKD